VIDNLSPPVGLLLSGGLDSSILLGMLLREGRSVHCLYVRSGLFWEPDELRAIERFRQAMASPRLCPVKVLDLPLADLYGEHWSVTGHGFPGAATPDDAVYLPGRNALLAIKAGIWCRVQRIDELALGILTGNPFPDATQAFFDDFESALNRSIGGRLRIVRPFAHLTKREVLQRGRGLPLELTFSCIAPVDGLHCGRCNKCAERNAAFGQIGLEDPTAYAAPLVARP